mgnify:CR=1 FL=1
MNKVLLKRKFIAASLEVAKFTTEHISTFNGLLNQLQDMGLQVFDGEMNSTLLVTLLETWEALLVSLSNSAHGVTRSIP